MIRKPNRQDFDAIYPISDKVFERLEQYIARLSEWQKKTNLIAPSTLDDVWNRHVADSLQCLALMPDERCWLDLGSGGGFPGMVIAAALADIPEATVTLVESNHKKTAFLRQVSRQMGARTNVITSRIEDYDCGTNFPGVVTARALTSLTNLLRLSEPWLVSGAAALFHKGRDYQAELEECNGVWAFDLVNHQSKILPDSVVLEIRNLKRITRTGS